MGQFTIGHSFASNNPEAVPIRYGYEGSSRLALEVQPRMECRDEGVSTIRIFNSFSSCYAEYDLIGNGHAPQLLMKMGATVVSGMGTL
jgi:hypothetical protein